MKKTVLTVESLTTLLEITGLSLLVACAAIVFWPAAFAVAGAGCLWLSHGLSQ